MYDFITKEELIFRSNLNFKQLKVFFIIVRLEIIFEELYQIFFSRKKNIPISSFYDTAKKLRTESLKKFHLKLTEKEIKEKLKRYFYMQDLNLFAIYTDILNKYIIPYFVIGSIKQY